ncbi:MAG: hypothetical protein GY765_13215, partial [bacterium]|nr:hypothetical protein [bacterium]
MKLITFIAVTLLFGLLSPTAAESTSDKALYDVGFKVVQLKDTGRQFKLKSGETTDRPIRFFVWYPAKKTATAKRLLYTDYLFLNEFGQRKAGLTTDEKSKLIQDFAAGDKNTDIKKRMEILEKLPAGAFENAEEINQKFPLLLFGPGGSTSAFFYSSMCETLAAQGYIAITLASLPTNEGERWPFDQSGLDLHINDMEMVLKYVKTQGKVDSENIGLLAFSVGGVSQALLQMKHTIANAFVSLDGGTGYGYGYGMLRASKHCNMDRMNIPYFHAHGLGKAQYIVKKDFTVFNKNKTRHKYLLTFDNLSHPDVTSLYQVKHKMAGKGKGDKTIQQYGVLNEAVLLFLNRFLKNDAGAETKLKAMSSQPFLTLEHYENRGSTRKRMVDDFSKNEDESAVALKEKDYESYKTLSHKLLQFTPTHPSYMYQYAKSLALTKSPEDCLAWLEELLNVKASRLKSITGDKSFESLFDNPKFKDLVQRAKKKLVAVNNSQTAFTIKERDLISEGVAYDTTTNTLYLGSIYKRKIIAVSPDGKVRNFAEEKQDGLLGLLGMEVDEKRRHLWACSSWSGRNDILGIKRGDPPKPTAIHKYHLESGKLIKKYTPANFKGHFFNDLTVNSKGDVFITDTFAGEVYTINAGKDTLELFSHGYLFPNGITISDDGVDLFVGD